MEKFLFGFFHGRPCSVLVFLFSFSTDRCLRGDTRAPSHPGSQSCFHTVTEMISRPVHLNVLRHHRTQTHTHRERDIHTQLPERSTTSRHCGLGHTPSIVCACITPSAYLSLRCQSINPRKRPQLCLSFTLHCQPPKPSDAVSAWLQHACDGASPGGGASLASKTRPDRLRPSVRPLAAQSGSARLGSDCLGAEAETLEKLLLLRL